jgi:hypothetical protein
MTHGQDGERFYFMGEGFFGEVDIPFRVAEPRFSSFVPRVVVGAGSHVKVGLNLTGNLQRGADALGNRNVTKGNHFLYAEVGFNFN